MKQNEVERKCIVTGQVLPRERLLRFTMTPEHKIVPDFKKKLPGKGIYVTNSLKCLEKAVSKNLFAKATQGKSRANKELLEQAQQLLHKRALDAFSLARKAGILVTGMEKVLEALKKNQLAWVLEAADAGHDGSSRVALAAKGTEIIKLFTTEELDRALNKVNTVYAGFKKGEMAQMVRQEFVKYAEFMNSEV